MHNKAMTFIDNPEYTQVFYSEVHGKAFYAPTQKTEYHTCRLIAANAIDIYAQSGITKTLQQAVLSKMLDIVNTEKNDNRLRSDISTLINNLLYRTEYPCDEDSAIRLGAVLTFIEGEDPNSYSLPFTQQKEELARGNVLKGITPDPHLYTFFLTLGIDAMPSFKSLSEDLKSTEFLEVRMKTLETMQLTSQNPSTEK